MLHLCGVEGRVGAHKSPLKVSIVKTYSSLKATPSYFSPIRLPSEAHLWTRVPRSFCLFDHLSSVVSRNLFHRELGGHDTLDSTKDATVLGRFLYRDLVRRSKIVNNPTPLNSVRRGGMGGGGTHTVGNTLRAAGEDMRRSLLSIRYTNTSGATNNGEGGSSQESDKKGSGSLGPAIAQRVASNTLANAPAGALVDRNGMISLAEEVKEEKSAVEASASATARTPLQMAAAAVVAASAGGRMSASSESKDELTSGIVLPKRSGQWSGMETAEGTAHLSGQAVAAIRQEVAVEVDEYDATNASSSASSSDAEGEEDGGILRADASFCPYLPDLLLEVAFKIFDLENDGVITKEVRCQYHSFTVTVSMDTSHGLMRVSILLS